MIICGCWGLCSFFLAPTVQPLLDQDIVCVSFISLRMLYCVVDSAGGIP